MKIATITGSGTLDPAVFIHLPRICVIVLRGTITVNGLPLHSGQALITDTTIDLSVSYTDASGIIFHSAELEEDYIPAGFGLKTDRSIEYVIGDNFLDFQSTEEVREAALTYIIKRLTFAEIAEDASAQASMTQKNIVGQVIDFMQNRLDEQLSSEDITNAAGVDRNSLNNEFSKAGLGTPLKYFSQMKLEKAKHLLENDKNSISQIALSLGYRDVSSFSHFFTKHTGKSPREFRDNLHWLL